MRRSWLDSYHEECAECVWDPVWSDRDSEYDYYWIRTTRRCRGHVAEFQSVLMPPGSPKSKPVARICTASYHGNKVHVHAYLSGSGERAETDIPCTPSHLDGALGNVDFFALQQAGQKIAHWKAGTWVHALQNLSPLG